MIRVRNLRKHYKVHERPPGVAAAFRSIFPRDYKTIAAVDAIWTASIGRYTSAGG
jgi:ABC-2 type transport system ATP-binding protein